MVDVRVVPGDPAANRPVGEVASPLFAWVAAISDIAAVLVGVVFWRRWRRWSWHEVSEVGDGVVSLVSQGRTLTVSTPRGWSARVQPGDRVSGSMHLVTDGDLLPGLPLSGLEQVSGASYVARGATSTSVPAGCSSRWTTGCGCWSRPAVTGFAPTSGTPPRCTAPCASPRR